MTKTLKLALVAGVLAGAVSTQAFAESADETNLPTWSGDFSAPIVSTVIVEETGSRLGPDWR